MHPNTKFAIALTFAMGIAAMGLVVLQQKVIADHHKIEAWGDTTFATKVRIDRFEVVATQVIDSWTVAVIRDKETGASYVRTMAGCIIPLSRPTPVPTIQP